MLHAMSSTVLRLACTAAVLALAACNLTKDGGADAAVAVPPPAATPVAPAAPAADPAAAPTAPVAPLGGPVTPTPGAKPVAAVDGGKPAADAGVTDGGKAPPAPTPTFAIPTSIPGFDAGAFKPPPGFPTSIPTTLPTFPPPAK
jgi:hypothetical protein